VSGGDCTLDGFLGGRVLAAQPAKGFRAGHDTILLAASVPARAGETVLELGSGAGIASLCLAARVRAARVLGIEIDPGLVALAQENAVRNALADRVRFVQGDVGLGDVGQDGVDAEEFDHVFFNPPFHRDTGQVSPHAARDRARRDTANAVPRWTARALSGVRDGGTVTAIISAGRKDDMLAAAGLYPVILFPLFPRAGEAAKRLLVRISKERQASARIARGLVLHEGQGNSAAAECVLRHGAGLDLTAD
jgi:tRNA1(Val) A37 N6-methylase TrmN6